MTPGARGGAWLGVMLLVSVAACARPGWTRSAPERAWLDVRVDAQRAVEGGQYARADSMLAAYARRHENRPEANEARYWRAVYLLDPANPKGSPRDSARLLGQYL